MTQGTWFYLNLNYLQRLSQYLFCGTVYNINIIMHMFSGYYMKEVVLLLHVEETSI